MTKKINLTVSDELAEKIDQYRDQLNQSAVFASAIQDEIRKLEIPTNSEDLTATVERLRPSHAEYETGHYRRGFEAGVDWAKHRGDYIALKRWGTLKTFPGVDGNGYLVGPGSTLTPSDPLWHASRKFSMQLSDSGPDYCYKLPMQNEGVAWFGATRYFNAEGYWQGWLDGVRSIWIPVDRKLNPPAGATETESGLWRRRQRYAESDEERRTFSQGPPLVSPARHWAGDDPSIANSPTVGIPARRYSGEGPEHPTPESQKT